jgi:large conductance mechanosensitive channel
MKSSGFISFLREQGVMGLAIGFILGGAVSKVVASLVSDIVNPAIAMIFGSREGITAMSFKTITYGNFVAVLIDFIIIAAVVYFLFKGMGLDKVDAKK